MRKLLTLGKWKELSLSVGQIRTLVWWLTAMSVLGVLAGGLALMARHVNAEATLMAQQFAQVSQDAYSRVDVARRKTLDAQVILEQMAALDAPLDPALQDGATWMTQLKLQGLRQYRGLPVSRPGQDMKADARLSTLAQLLSAGWRINNEAFRDVRNAYLLDLKKDQFVVIPRWQGEAQDKLDNATWRNRYIDQILARARSADVLQQLYAEPQQPLLLMPGTDPLSGKDVITYAQLIQVRGQIVAILMVDFAASAMLPEQPGAMLPGGLTMAPAFAPDHLFARTPQDIARVRAVAPLFASAEVDEPDMAPWRVLLRDHALLLSQQQGDWLFRTVVPMNALWPALGPQLLQTLGVTLAIMAGLLCWMALIDTRILRPTLRQSRSMQESEALGRAMLRIAQVGLLVVRVHDCRIVRANGLARKQVEGAASGELARLVAQSLQASSTTDRSDAVARIEFSLADKKGDLRLLDVCAAATQEQGVACLLLALDDRTQEHHARAHLNAAVAEAAQANRAKSAFLATMSHEIRTPLNGMLGGLELLSMTALDDQQRERLDVVRRSSGNLIATINDVLDFSKIEAGQMIIRPAPCSVLEVVEGVARNFADIAAQKGLDLYCLIDPVLQQPVLLDGMRLEQVLSNLVSNAIKFTGKGKVVLAANRVQTGDAPSVLELKVIDTGIGIAPEDQKRLFEPFIQAEQSDTRSYGGTGLGLSICKRLIGLMEGEITLNSELGFGAAFRISVPLAPVPDTTSATAPVSLRGVSVQLALSMPEMENDLAHWLRWHDATVLSEDTTGAADTLVVLDSVGQAAGLTGDVVLSAGMGRDAQARPARVSWFNRQELLNILLMLAGRGAPAANVEAQAQPGAPARRRVLLVEDNPINQAVMRTQFEALGQSVDVVGDGQAALARIGQSSYDLIVTDIQMPRMDGYTLTRTLRTQGVTLPVVAITANVYQDEHARCHAAGVDRCLIKPVQMADLRQLLIELDGDPGAEIVPADTPQLPIALIINTLQSDLDTLRQAWQQQDLPALKARAHALGGGLAVLGHSDMSDLARAMEQAAAGNDKPALAKAWGMLETQLDHILASLRAGKRTSAMASAPQYSGELH